MFDNHDYNNNKYEDTVITIYSVYNINNLVWYYCILYEIQSAAYHYIASILFVSIVPSCNTNLLLLSFVLLHYSTVVISTYRIVSLQFLKQTNESIVLFILYCSFNDEITWDDTRNKEQEKVIIVNNSIFIFNLILLMLLFCFYLATTVVV